MRLRNFISNKLILLMAVLLVISTSVRAEENPYKYRIPYKFTNGSEVWFLVNEDNKKPGEYFGQVVLKDFKGRTAIIYSGDIKSLPSFPHNTNSTMPTELPKLTHDLRSSALVFGTPENAVLIDSTGLAYKLPQNAEAIDGVSVRHLLPGNVNFSGDSERLLVAFKVKGEEEYSNITVLDRINGKGTVGDARTYSFKGSVKLPAVEVNRADSSHGIFKLYDRSTGEKKLDIDLRMASKTQSIHAADFIQPQPLEFDESKLTHSHPTTGAANIRLFEDGIQKHPKGKPHSTGLRFDINIDADGANQEISLHRSENTGFTDWNKITEGNYDTIKLSHPEAVFPKPFNMGINFLPPLEISDGMGNAEVVILGNLKKMVIINQARSHKPIEINYPAWKFAIDGNTSIKNIQIEYFRGADGQQTNNFVMSVWEDDISGKTHGKGITLVVSGDSGKYSTIDSAIKLPFEVEFDPKARVIGFQKGKFTMEFPEDSAFDKIFTDYEAYREFVDGTKKQALANLPATIDNDSKTGTAFSGYPTKGAEILYSQQVKNLEKFRETMKAGMIGQDIAIDNMYDATIAHYLNPKLTDKPISFFAVGVSGSGKTEFGKTLADAMYPSLYKDKPAFQRIDMGMIKEKHEASNVFGGTKSYVGSDSPGFFEQALIDMPDGGVIIFDEASNVGGEAREGKKVKSDVFKSLYSIVDEGKFRSTNTNTPDKVYDLSKYVFVFTGNDAEKLFFGTNSEQKLINIWRENATPEKIKALLQDSNIPNPFLNRLDFIMMFKPLTKAEMRQVAGIKFLQPVLKEFEKTYGVKIKVSDKFIDQLVDLFYSPTDGARGIRNFVSNKISAAISKEIYALRSSPGSLADLQIELNIREELNPKRPSVFLEVHTNLAGMKAMVEHNVSPFAKLDSHFGLDSSGNPLENRKLMERLSNFKTKLSARIIGQDYLVDTVSDAVYAHFTNPELKDRPLSGMVVGTTGTGKTELGKGIAEALFGSDSENYVQTIKLGDIKNTADANTLFQAPKGYVDSDEIGLFEQSLKKMRNGGVLIFDEASNMGGGDKKQKEALFKLFYDFKEKGKWKSPITNIEYDLSNYVFLYTGNDGQEHFKGMGNDDMRMSVYNRHKSRQAVTATLVEGGTPEPFLGRQDFVAMMKPLVRSEMRQITKVKFLEPVLESYRKTYGVDFKYDEKFVDRLSKTFFTHEQGARALRPITEHSLGATIAELLRGFIDNPASVKGKVFELTFADSLTYKPYRVGPESERVVALSASFVGEDGKVVKVVKDISGHAPDVYKPTSYDARATAYHEAGHFVVNEPLLTNQKPRFLTIEAVGQAAGYLGFEDAHKVAHFDRQKVVARIATLMGGQMASMMAGYPKDMGWSSDLEMIRKYAREYILNSGMSQGLTTVRVDAQGMPILDGDQMDIFKREFEAILMESYTFARNRLESGWGLVRRSALTLLSKGSISGRDLEKMQGNPKYYELSDKKVHARRVEFHELFAIDPDHGEFFGKRKVANPIGFVWGSEEANAPIGAKKTPQPTNTRMMAIPSGSSAYCAEFYKSVTYNIEAKAPKVSSISEKLPKNAMASPQRNLAGAVSKKNERQIGAQEMLKSAKVVW